MTHNMLLADFFERLSPKKEALLQVLLDAEGEWVRGVDLREQMAVVIRSRILTPL